MGKKVHILCTMELTDDQAARVQRVAPEIVIERHPITSDDAVTDLLSPEVNVLLGSHAKFSLDKAPNLRWLQTYSAGVEFLRGTPIWESDIAITSANGVHAVQIGEYILLGIMAHFHRLPTMQRLQLNRSWPDGSGREALTPRELRGATLGVVGYGAIGREAARLAAGFGMRVVATRPRSGELGFAGWTSPGTGDPEGIVPEAWYELDHLHDLLRESDAVALCLPLTEKTRHIIAGAELAAMRRDAMLINIGRGGLIDQDALVAALQDHTINGAVLDVTDPEPLPPESPLWSMAQVILTPHIAGRSTLYNDRVVELFAANLQRFLRGERLLNLVERDHGY